MSRVERLDKIKKKALMGASLMRNMIIYITIFSISLTARRREESGPLIKHPTMIADTRTSSSSSSAKAKATLLGMMDSKTWTITS